MSTYEVLIQKFVSHRILSFFITVYSILQTSDYIFMLTSSTHRTFLFVLSIIRNCLLTNVIKQFPIVKNCNMNDRLSYNDLYINYQELHKIQ